MKLAKRAWPKIVCGFYLDHELLIHNHVESLLPHHHPLEEHRHPHLARYLVPARA
jgi:hypothetical protein